MQPRDLLDRPLRTVRISVTDRCNFRCRYCMPREAPQAFSDRGALLTFEEMAAIVRALARRGVANVRLTGGEPLLRRGLEDLVAAVRAVPGIADVAMTTNGSLLGERAESLAASGLDRVTVSLDALDEDLFRQITDGATQLRRVLEAIAVAAEAGLTPVKVNTVVRRGRNEGQVELIAGHFRGTGVVPRFIEYMDVGTSNGWQRSDVVEAAEIVERISARWPLEHVPRGPGAVAERWQYADGAGEVGIIASVTRPFCGDCTRVRLTADGKLFLCLFGRDGIDLRSVLRSGASPSDLGDIVAGAWQRRDDRYSESRDAMTVPWPRMEMNYVGG